MDLETTPSTLNRAGSTNTVADLRAESRSGDTVIVVFDAHSSVPPTSTEAVPGRFGGDTTVAAATGSAVEGEFPADWRLLERAEQDVLNPDDRELWGLLNQGGRVRLLERARQRSEARQQRALQQAERERLCAAYIDALCRLSEVPAAQRPAVRAELDSARAAWFAVRGRRR